MKYPPHGSVRFCSVSIDEGLILLANPLFQAIANSCSSQTSGRLILATCGKQRRTTPDDFLTPNSLVTKQERLSRRRLFCAVWIHS
jgi:hypothetical protein